MISILYQRVTIVISYWIYGVVVIVEYVVFLSNFVYDRTTKFGNFPGADLIVESDNDYSCRHCTH